MKLPALTTALSIAALATALGVVPALADPGVEGRWWSGPRDVGYEFRLCGEDNQQLCAWLTYAADPSARVQRYVGTQVMQPATRVGPQSWRGNIYIAGFHLDGTITLASSDRVQVDGCVAFIICGEYNVYRE